MRHLAVARFRLWTTIRPATPIFIIAAIPPLTAAIIESVSEPIFRATAETALPEFARVAVAAWLFHAFVIVAASEAFGNRGLFRNDLSVPSDLMDSAPIAPLTRFWGEALGIFAATLTIHVSCLPLLAVVAVLSPLPTVFFVWMETVILLLISLGSAGAAWKRLRPRTRWSSTRTFRSGLLFLILFFFVLFATTRWTTLRDSWFTFLWTPSMRTWHDVAAAVENPILLGLLLFMLYSGYIAFYVNTSRKPAET